MKIRDICIMAILAVVMFASQVVMSFLPNIELVSLLVILYTVVYGKRIVGILCVFTLLEGLTYGFGLWFIMYLYIWPILAVIAYLFRRMESYVGWAVLSGVFGLLFGALCSVTYLILTGPVSAWAFFISGIPFDMVHCVGNFLLALFLLKPLKGLVLHLDKRIQRM